MVILGIVMENNIFHLLLNDKRYWVILPNILMDAYYIYNIDKYLIPMFESNDTLLHWLFTTRNTPDKYTILMTVTDSHPELLTDSFQSESSMCIENINHLCELSWQTITMFHLWIILQKASVV